MSSPQNSQSKLAITAGREKKKNFLYEHKAFISVINTGLGTIVKKCQSVKIKDTIKINVILLLTGS